MSKMTPLQEVAALDHITICTKLYKALTEVEETLTVEISTDWFIRNKGRLTIWDKDSDKWLGFQKFDLTGVKDLPEYFANLLDEFKG